MLLQMYLVLCCFSLITPQASFQESSEYLVNNTDRANYLETFFDNTESYIFPSNLKLSVLLMSFAEGLLFYSIDRNSNQFIVSFKPSIGFSIAIEFRGSRNVISAKELCNCKICLHEKLNFQFRIKNNFIEIACNQNDIIKISFPQRKQLNENYPLPKFDINDKISAYLWLINTPTYKNGDSTAYPNNGHLSGRFSHIMYKDIPLNLSIVGSSNKCNNMCTDDLCNGGQCLETFQCKPVCDCTETFLNGEFCNSTISSYGKQKNNISFQLLKLSWTGSQGNLFKISNKRMELHISLFISPVLCFEYRRSSYSIKSEFAEIYPEKEQFISIIALTDKSIKIRFKKGMNQWKFYNIPVNGDLSMEHFDNTVFTNNSLDQFVYKEYVADFKWNAFNYLKSFQNSTENDKMEQKINGTEVVQATMQSDFISISILVILNLCSICGCILLYKVYRSEKRSSNAN